MSAPISFQGITVVTPAHCKCDRVSDTGKAQIKAYRQEVRCRNLSQALPYLYVQTDDRRSVLTVEEFGKKTDRIEIVRPTIVNASSYRPFWNVIWCAEGVGISLSDIEEHGSKYMDNIRAVTPSDSQHPLVIGDALDNRCLLRFLLGMPVSRLRFCHQSFDMLWFDDFAGFSMSFDSDGSPFKLQLVGKHQFSPVGPL